MIDAVKMEADRRLMTAEDLLRLGSDANLELWDGAGIVRSPSGGWAEFVVTRILWPLCQHVYSRELGWVTASSQGFFVRRDPDRVLAPDTAFISFRTAPTLPRRGFLECAPDFCVEVKSPDDSWTATIEKCGIWVAHGVPVVWAVNPETQAVVVFRGLATPQEAGPGDTVDATPALPEFRLAVSDLFVGLH